MSAPAVPRTGEPISAPRAGRRAAAAAPGSRTFRPDIQGLRAIAVLAVVLFHAGVPGVPGGYAGVDVFFVISGFLITGHLLAERAREGRIRFGAFYARRVRRLLPASFVVLVATVAAAWLLLPPLRLPEVLQDAVWTALYVPNVLFASTGTDYLADPTPSVFQHYWSLGVEEQFYLLWPLLLVAVAWIARRRPIVAGLLIGVLGAASLVACVLVSEASQPTAFFLLPTRAWEFAAGGAVAIVLRRRPEALPPALARILGWLGLVAVVAAVTLLTSATLYPGIAAVLPVAGTALVILAGGTPVRGGPAVVLGLRPAQFIGRISYSLYLVHWPLLVIPQQRATLDHPLGLHVELALVVIAVPLAWLLQRFVEVPGRSAAVLVRRRPRLTLLTAAIASALVVVTAVGLGSVAVAPQLASAHLAVDGPLTAPPVATPFVPRNLHPSLRQAAYDIPVLYRDHCERDYLQDDPAPCRYGTETRSIALFGDSHAAQWFPGLLNWARDHRYRVDVYTKSSCPSADVPLLLGTGPFPACARWRAGVLRRLKADPPAVVIVANFDRTPILGGNHLDATWTAGLERTVRGLPASSAAIVLADTPDLVETPSTCLSANLDATSRCTVPASRALDAHLRADQRTAARATGASFVDLSAYFCTASTCPPVIGATLVYRDAHHMTATFSREIGPHLGDAVLQALGHPHT